MSDFAYEDLIGVPFAYGGRGPETYDCWGLVMELARRRGITLPDYGSSSEMGVIAAKMAVGIQVFQPCERKPGAILAIRIPDSNGVSVVRHVGMLLPYEKFIHTWEKSGGVAIERAHDWRHRITGAYRYVG